MLTGLAFGRFKELFTLSFFLSFFISILYSDLFEPILLLELTKWDKLMTGESKT